ncbi:hypothetical protein FOA52_002656 [Chlamydomonas sp. UWO 241]|nr:hypothetical protein FOA52_002656 [Chlamydomonas sp. UWO 241]
MHTLSRQAHQTWLPDTAGTSYHVRHGLPLVRRGGGGGAPRAESAGVGRGQRRHVPCCEPAERPTPDRRRHTFYFFDPANPENVVEVQAAGAPDVPPMPTAAEALVVHVAGSDAGSALVQSSV